MQKKGQGTYNAVVIGAGTAGLVTAAGTASLGGRVALIERNKMGGDCLNFGCVPSKALISSARLIEQIRQSEKLGLRKQEPQFEFAEVMQHMRERRAKIEPNDSQERFESLGVDVFRGEAKFKSPHELEVDGRRLHGRTFVIATGSRAAIPRIEGLNSVTYFTNETVFDQLHDIPASMIVLGGGPIGCELGQAFARLGVRVTIVQSAAQLLPAEDANVAAFLHQRLTSEGIDIRLNGRAHRVCQENGEIMLDLGYKTITAAAMLVAAGRTPNLRALDLEAAGVEYDERGVKVNEFLQTSQRHIYAAGDVTHHPKFTHTADFTARIVVRNILMPVSLLRQKVNWSIVPWCTFTDPEIAHVGLNEKKARNAGIKYDVFRVELEHVDRAVVESEDGFAKILTRKGSDEILGVTIVGPHAGDLLHEFVVAMHAHLGLAKLASIIHIYPTLAELARKAGDQYNKTRLTPRAKVLFAWLYRRARRG